MVLNHSTKTDRLKPLPGELSAHTDPSDPLINILTKVIVGCVKALAVLMTIVILWATIDVGLNLYNQLSISLTTFFSIEAMITLLGAFLAVLIAIEIFLNIVLYLQKDIIHVPLVVATALTAASRKAIVMDYMSSDPIAIFALAAVISALGATYWLVSKSA